MADLIVRGQWQFQAAGRDPVLGPWDGSTIDTVPRLAGADVDDALDWAAERARQCAEWPVADRIAVVRAWADLIEHDAVAIARTESAEMGKPIRQSTAVVLGVVARLRSFAAVAEVSVGAVLPTPGRPAAHVVVGREPLGLVCGLLPFNSPVSAMAWKLAPALLMGNASIIKPSSKAPLAVLRATHLLAGLGLPDGAVQVIAGDGRSIGAAMAAHPAVRHISLTGGTESGQDVWRQAAASMARLTLECGSSDPLIVLDDADVEAAVRTVAEFGFRRYSGQLCTAPKRCIVAERHADAFIQGLAATAGAIELGDPLDEHTDFGPLVSPDAAEAVHRQVLEAAAMGATLVAGGARDGRAGYRPTVMSDVAPGTPMYRDVPFGPVVTVYRAASDVAAVALANDSPYGIRASVFGKDLVRAMRVARLMDTGGVVINGPGAVGADPHLSVDPRGLSGVGAEGVMASLEANGQRKTIWVEDAWGPLTS